MSHLIRRAIEAARGGPPSLETGIGTLLPPWRNPRAPWLVVAALLLVGVGLSIRYLIYVPPVQQGLEAIRASGRLVVLTRMAPTTYYLGTEGETGFDYEMTQSLGRALGVEVAYRVYDTEPELLAALAARKGQLAAAGLVATAGRRKLFAAAPSHQTVRQLVICRRGIARPKKAANLVGLRIAVAEGTSGADALAALAGKTPGLVVVQRRAPVEHLLAAVAEGGLDCTAANSPELQTNNPYFPELIEAFALTGEEPVAWLAAPGSEDLADYLKGWIAAERKSGALLDSARRFFGFLPPFDYVDVRAFRDAVGTVLPDYEVSMRDAARETGLPWQLIAAVAYQESHWNPKAKSGTGVRGIMMLTEDTARHLGVEDRLDPIESIHAGARYIADLKSRMPESVGEPDRLWFALAAYNMGLAHLSDARALANRLGLDADKWTGLRRALSLMHRPEYAKSLKFGPAKGGQALRFVQQVRAYRHILDAPGA